MPWAFLGEARRALASGGERHISRIAMSPSFRAGPAIRFLRIYAVCIFAIMTMCGVAAAQSGTAGSAGGFSFSQIFDPRTSPFIPIPEVGTDPNSGTTVGLLPVFLTNNPNGQISRIFAPDVIYNPDLGYGGHVRLFSYPSPDTQWHVIVGAKQRFERELDLTYTTGLKRQQQWSLDEKLIYDRSATERFFGFGNSAPFGNQTNYTIEQEYVDASAGWNIDPNLQIAYHARPRVIQVERGVLSRLPSIESRFPQLSGLGGEHEFLNRVFLSYDTRDSISIPTKGVQLVAFASHVDNAVLSSVSYTSFGFDARGFVPLDERFTLAGHSALRYMPGNSAPFWAQSSLGGDRSVLGERQPLRGFGNDRFVDRNSFSASIELRSRVYDLDLFATRLSLELAPFIDAGRVFHRLDDNPLRSLHLVEGIGVRAVASPFIVGYVDIGHGSDGTAIFSSLDYPF